MSTVYVLTAINEGKVAECIAIPPDVSVTQDVTTPEPPEGA